MIKKPRFSWRNLTPQLVAIVILPLAIFTLIVVFGGLLLHQDSMRKMVGERDERTVRAAAAAMTQELIHRFDMINMFLDILDDQSLRLSEPPSYLQADLAVSDFNRGIALLDDQGRLLWVAGGSGTLDKLFLQAHEEFHSNDQTDKLLDYEISQDASNDEQVIFLLSGENRHGMRLIGAHSLDDLIERVVSEVVGSAGSGMGFFIASQDEIIYSHGDIEDISASEGLDISQMLEGKSGSAFLGTGPDEHVMAYSSVDPFNWLIVIEEPWKEVASPLLRRTEYAPLLVVPILLLALVAIWFGTRYVVQPLQRLESRATALAWGDYKTIEKPVGGIAEIQHLQTELVHLAYKVKTAQQGLRSYIGAITMGQEDERRRLARELHDDTLQALIALNQQIQLAELNLDNSSTSETFAGVRSLIDETIVNLRRITRALRPIYLEDLGLSAALEMLVHEIGTEGNIAVEFRKSGNERRLPATAELALYRIAQEALNNVVRHANPNRAELRIKFDADHVLLEVQDDGQGFEVPESPAELAPGGHYGLLGLYERAELIGGSLEINSRHAVGTTVRLVLPVSSIEDLPV